MASSQAAIRFVSATKKTPTGTFYLQCYVKPGASKNREGVMSVTEEVIELCVAAQAREGEANKAVVRVLSGILGVPKTDLQITQGQKSRDKTVALSRKDTTDHQSFMEKLKQKLEADANE